MTDLPDPSQFLEPQPTEQQKALWDKFVYEYVKDFHPIAAAIRVGFNMNYAQEYSRLFMGYPYIQRKIMEYKSKPPETDDPDKLAKIRQRIESVLIGAMECGDPKVQVAAAAKLGEMHGLMEAPDKSGDELNKLVNAFKDIAKAVPD